MEQIQFCHFEAKSKEQGGVVTDCEASNSRISLKQIQSQFFFKPWTTAYMWPRRWGPTGHKGSLCKAPLSTHGSDSRPFG